MRSITENYQMALVGGQVGQYRLSIDVPVPKPVAGEMLVKVHAVALNPADYKLVDDTSVVPSSIGGNDFAGEVVEIGAGVSRFKTGDRVFAMMFGLNPADRFTGCFCQYAIATEDLACKVPDEMTYEEAATFAVGIGTAGSTLFQMMGLPLPYSAGTLKNQGMGPSYVLVSGGASATGIIAIQLLKASGLTPIATCSPSSRNLVLSLGALETFDYHSPTCGMEIRNYTKGGLSFALDCVTQPQSMRLCYEAIGTEGGRYVGLDPFPATVQYTRRDIKAEWQNALCLFGNAVKLSGPYARPARAKDREFAKVWFPIAERLIADRLLRPCPIEVRSGGLQAVTSGINDLRSGQIRGRKLVYQII